MSEQISVILQTVSAIPEGQLSSYGRIASTAGYAGCARQVGYALKQLPEDSRIPWHRVVNAQGKISFPENSEKYYEQKRRLLAEGHPQTLTTSHFKSVLWPQDEKPPTG